MRGEGGSLDMCALCDYTSHNKSHVDRHVENKHAPLHLKQIQCDFCGYVCPSKSAHFMHIKLKHKMSNVWFMPVHFILF